MKKLTLLLATLVVANSFGENPNSNRNANANQNLNNNNYSNFFEYERNTQRKVDVDFNNFKEKVQIVNISELEGKTFIIQGKAYIIPQRNVIYIGTVNYEGRIDLEKVLKFQTLDDNCITIDGGKTCFTVRSSNMLPELIRVSDGKTISTGYWKNKEFHEFLLKWKNK